MRGSRALFWIRSVLMRGIVRQRTWWRLLFLGKALLSGSLERREVSSAVPLMPLLEPEVRERGNVAQGSRNAEQLVER